MKISSITIQNFHCFEKQTFDFARKTSVFIGKNGTGKSSLLRAVTNALSFIFNKSQNSWGYSSLAKEVTDLSVNTIGVREIYHNGNIADFVSLYAEANLDTPFGDKKEIKWELKKNAFERSSLQTALYQTAYVDFRRNVEATNVLPLIVYYSDRYPHVNTNLGKNVQALLNKEDFISRTWGYYHWCEFTSCAEIWQKRFIKVFNRLTSMDKVIASLSDDETRESMAQKRDAFQKEIDYVTNLIKRFTSDELEMLSDKSRALKVEAVIVDGATDFNIKFIFADGVERYWNELPAGLERLFSIVFDIAYRSFILNEGRVQPSGIVLIDEIDLHLHPSLEQDVLNRFRQAFPDIQLIVTTHSPLVITNFKQDEENMVCRMSRNGFDYTREELGDMYGMDYDIALSEVMSTEPRNIYVSSLVNRYIRQKHRGVDDMAAMTLQELRQLVSEEQMETLLKENNEN